MGNKDILKVLSKSDEKRRSCSVYKPKFRKIPPFTPPRTPQNHPTVTIFNRVSLRWVKKIFWKFYQNRMKIGGAVLFTSPCHTHGRRSIVFDVRGSGFGTSSITRLSSFALDCLRCGFCWENIICCVLFCAPSSHACFCTPCCRPHRFSDLQLVESCQWLDDFFCEKPD